jgi:hypothetical protein
MDSIPNRRKPAETNRGKTPDFSACAQVGTGLAILLLTRTKSERLGQFSWFGAASELPWLG